jgi:hypothetical protein
MITTIRQFLSESQLNIEIPGLYSSQPLRENDYNIMGELMKIEKSPIAIQRLTNANFSYKSPGYLKCSTHSE